MHTKLALALAAWLTSSLATANSPAYSQAESDINYNIAFYTEHGTPYSEIQIFASVSQPNGQMTTHPVLFLWPEDIDPHHSLQELIDALLDEAVVTSTTADQKIMLFTIPEETNETTVAEFLSDVSSTPIQIRIDDLIVATESDLNEGPDTEPSSAIRLVTHAPADTQILFNLIVDPSQGNTLIGKIYRINDDRSGDTKVNRHPDSNLKVTKAPEVIKLGDMGSPNPGESFKIEDVSSRPIKAQ